MGFTGVTYNSPYLERQVSYFLSNFTPKNPATIALKLGYSAFQVYL